MWGAGGNGQLGVGEVKKNTKGVMGDSYVQRTPKRLRATAVQSGVKSLGVGKEFTIGVSSGGHLLAWGRTWGLGNGAKPDVLEPVALDLEPRWVMCAAGGAHGAAVDTNGQVYTFGPGTPGFFKSGGALGHGDKEAYDTPTLVESFRSYGALATSVSCGDKHTLILTDDGELLACGVGEYGRLGTGDSGDELTPVTIEALVDEEVVQAGAGAYLNLTIFLLLVVVVLLLLLLLPWPSPRTSHHHRHPPL
jgi:alpha-tubulin suppressor-like RCC1 family protein